MAKFKYAIRHDVLNTAYLALKEHAPEIGKLMRQSVKDLTENDATEQGVSSHEPLVPTDE